MCGSPYMNTAIPSPAPTPIRIHPSRILKLLSKSRGKTYSPKASLLRRLRLITCLPRRRAPRVINFLTDRPACSGIRYALTYMTQTRGECLLYSLLPNLDSVGEVNFVGGGGCHWSNEPNPISWVTVSCGSLLRSKRHLIERHPCIVDFANRVRICAEM